MEQIGKTLKKCDAPWCVPMVPIGKRCCPMHMALPVKVYRVDGQIVNVEDADTWKTRYRAFQKAQKAATDAQAESDAKIAKR